LIVYAWAGITYYQVNGGGATVKIDENDLCQNVQNNGSQALFVPTKTTAEWS